MASGHSTLEAQPGVMVMKHTKRGIKTDYYEARRLDSWPVP
jgi:hypothetical protein